MRFAAPVALVALLMVGSFLPTAARGRNSLRIALDITPNSLNPILRTTTTEGLIESAIFDGLVYATPNGSIRPVLAAIVPSTANGGISRDGRTIVYKLRHGVRWHDGARFSSRDVAFTQSAFTNPKNNVTARDPFRFVANVSTPDDYTVVVHLRQRYAPFVVQWLSGGGLGVLPAHLLGAYRQLNDIPFNAAPVGTGAFIFERWERGRQIVLRENDRYFAGKPHVQRILMQLMSDENARDVALEAGETDWSFQASATSARQIAGRGRIRARALTVNAFCALRLQVHRPSLGDIRVRRAIALALDRPMMVAKISGAFARPASVDIGPAVWAYTPALRTLPFDPTRSRALLVAAGWTLGPLGERERAGKPLLLDLVYASGSSAYDAYAIQIQAMLREVGIAVNVKSQPANVLFAPAAQKGTLASGRFDLALSASYNSADPDDRRNFACESQPPNGFNFSRWCNPAYEHATNDGLLHADRATRKRDYARASQILVDDVPAIFLYWPKDLQLVRAGVNIDDGAGNRAQPYLWRKAVTP